MGASRCRFAGWLLAGFLLSAIVVASEPPVVESGDVVNADSPATDLDPLLEITPMAVTAPPAPPYVDNPATNGSGTYLVTWGNVLADGYTLQEKKGSGAWVTVASHLIKEQYTVTNRTSGSYSYRVKACLDGLCGAYQQGPLTTVTVVAPTVMFTATPATIAAGQSSTLNWSSVNAAACTLDGAAVALTGSQGTGPLSLSRSYNMSCSNTSFSTPASVTIIVAPPPTVTFSADATSIGYNQSTMLRWTTSDASTCSLDGVSVPVNNAQSTGALTSNKTYNLSCSGVGGTTARSVSITVVQPPTVTFTADATTIGINQSTTLRWTSSNATDGCTLDGASIVVNGSQSTGALTASKTYSLSCTNLGGATPRSVTITVIPVPTVTLSADADQVPINGSTTLRWSSVNAISCTLNGAAVVTSGSQSTGALATSKLFTFACSGLGGNNSTAVTVTPVSSPIITLTADQNPLVENTSTKLRWTSSNATSCTLDGVEVAINGSSGTGILATSKTFTMQCAGPGGSSTESLAVTVVPVAQIWNNVGQCDVQTGKQTQMCVDSRFCTVSSLQQVNGNCLQSADCAP
ncbi:MAG: hypothetical protein ACK4E7_13255 [Permianibacter sp.]